LTFSRFKKLILSRYAAALAAGICLASSFPELGIAGLAWIAPGLFVAIGLGLPGAEAFRVSYLAALTHYLASLSWLLNIPYRWLGIPLAPLTGWLALAAFMALWPAVWVWLMTRDAKGRFPREPSAGTATWDFARLSACLPATWTGRLAWSLLGAAAWVAMEMFVTRIFGGFPWNLLAASQYGMIPLLQVATVTGVYGVSFLVVWVSLSLLCAGLALLGRPQHRSQWVAELFVPVLTLALLLNHGFRQIQRAPATEPALSLVLVQPSIPQTLIWDPDSDDTRFQLLLDLTRKSIHPETDLVIWPEAAVPKLLRYDQDTYDQVTGLARAHRVWMIIGADDAEPRMDTPDPKDADFFNSSFLINPQGELVARYKKRSLVIFGEYIPLARWLPFLSWFTPIQGGFTAGTEPVPFHLDTFSNLQTSVLICFEDVFPQIGRSAAQQGADFLINLTNDGWFGEGSAQRQQAATAVFRAVENRVPLIRCTNTGLTCWIDAYGRIRREFRDQAGSIYGQGTLAFELPLPQTGRPEPTFYTRYGDVFGWACVAVTGLAFTALLVPEYILRRGSPPSSAEPEPRQ
jgi:apolipoprotein N-acyltransferase